MRDLDRGCRPGSAVRLGSPAWEISKSRLLGNVQLLLQEGQLKTGSGIAEPPNLLLRLEGELSGGHDDIVVAVPLALWRAN
jgi:hypothetical protein